MQTTLYERAKKIEILDELLEEIGGHEHVGVVLKKLFQDYEKNPVLKDAIEGKQSVEESVIELAQINKGFRKIMPWRLNKEHNERLNHLGQLVTKPTQLQTEGVWMPDNLTTMTAEAAITAFGTCYLIAKYLVSPNLDNATPQEYQNIMSLMQLTVPAVLCGFYVPLFGGMSNAPRLRKLPLNEAQYLDSKVQEIYN